MTQPDAKLPAKRETPLREITFGQRGLELRSIDDAWRFAQYAVKSGMAPKSIDSPEKALVAIQYGAELGLNAMRALTSINVINGVPSLKGEAVLALIRRSGVCDVQPVVGNLGEADERCGFIRFKRRDMPDLVELRFTVAEAKRAGLWGKTTRNGEPTPWASYPDDMMVWRAVSRAGKRYFSDVLLGFDVAEAVEDAGAAVETTARVLPSRPSSPDPLLILEATAPAEVHEEPASSPTPAGAVEAAGQPSLPLSPWTAGDESRCIECKRLRSRIGHLGHEDGCSLGGEK